MLNQALNSIELFFVLIALSVNIEVLIKKFYYAIHRWLIMPLKMSNAEILLQREK